MNILLQFYDQALLRLVVLSSFADPGIWDWPAEIGNG
jgi:hypothetical protein